MALGLWAVYCRTGLVYRYSVLGKTNRIEAFGSLIGWPRTLRLVDPGAEGDLN